MPDLPPFDGEDIEYLLALGDQVSPCPLAVLQDIQCRLLGLVRHPKVSEADWIRIRRRFLWDREAEVGAVRDQAEAETDRILEVARRYRAWLGEQ